MNARRYVIAAIALVAIGATGCEALPELPAMISGDWMPPVLLAVEAREDHVVALTFDEEVMLTDATFDPPAAVLDAVWRGTALEIEVDRPFAPGAEYWIDAVVEDTQGNISSLLVGFWGANPDLPAVLINEVVCEGSSTNPDWVELRLLEAGNVGGLTLYEGSPGIWDSRVTLPDLDLPAGAYIVVHFKPTGDPSEINETDDPAASGGFNATDTAWDVWVAGGNGIPNSTGALTLTAWPGGPIVDAFLYSTRTYDAASELDGFGLASQQAMFQELVSAGAWQAAGDTVVPDDGFDPDPSTATRSIVRDESAADTDSKADWFVVPTSGATPGRPNTTERYAP